MVYQVHELRDLALLH